MMKSIKLLDICRPKQWPTIATQDMTDKGYPVYGANGIIGYYSEYTHSNSTILITCRGASCGTINICLPYSYVNGNAMALDNLNSDVDINYLAYILKVRGFDDIITGSAQPQITRTSLSKIKIPLPPLATQKHIADILDAADALRRKTQQIVDSYDELAQSLFLEMFGDPVRNEKGWDYKKIKDLSIKFTDGPFGSNLKSEHYSENGILVIRLQNIGNNIFIEENVFIGENHYNKVLKKYTCYPNDVVIATMGTPNIRACIIPNKIKISVNKADCVLFRANTELTNPYFISHIFNLKGFLHLASSYIHGQTRSRISSGQIAKIKIPTPPLALQNQFAEKITLIEQQKELAKQSLAESENLFNALLQKAFKGELVPKPQPAEQAV
jgi:type I restriction enzyme S subunit